MICRIVQAFAALIFLASGTFAAAGTVEATRTLRSGAVIDASDVMASYTEPRRNEITRVEDAIGMEVRSSIREGRKIRRTDLRYPVLIKRNQLVDIVYRRGQLVIRGEGRALRDGGKGEAIRVMNLDSRMIVTGRVGPDGQVEVSR